jgi:acylphosphatase
MNARAHVIFSGKVQGVWFRANTQQKAVELGVNGWVRNLPGGPVEAVFEGDKGRIETVINWCSHYQPYAKVDSAEVEWEEFKNEFNSFEVRR